MIRNAARLARLKDKIEGLEHQLEDKVGGLERQLEDKIEGLERQLEDKIEGLERQLERNGKSIDILAGTLKQEIELESKKVEYLRLSSDLAHRHLVKKTSGLNIYFAVLAVVFTAAFGYEILTVRDMKQAIKEANYQLDTFDKLNRCMPSLFAAYRAGAAKDRWRVVGGRSRDAANCAEAHLSKQADDDPTKLAVANFYASARELEAESLFSMARYGQAIQMTEKVLEYEKEVLKYQRILGHQEPYRTLSAQVLKRTHRYRGFAYLLKYREQREEAFGWAKAVDSFKRSTEIVKGSNPDFVNLAEIVLLQASASSDRQKYLEAEEALRTYLLNVDGYSSPRVVLLAKTYLALAVYMLDPSKGDKEFEEDKEEIRELLEIQRDGRKESLVVFDLRFMERLVELLDSSVANERGAKAAAWLIELKALQEDEGESATTT